MGTERLYCAIFHFPPSETRTPDPRHGPRFRVSSISSNQAVLRSAEKSIWRSWLKWRTLMEDGRRIGHTYSHPDLVLAATALHHGLTVVTRDRSDFDKARVPVFNPWEPA